VELSPREHRRAPATTRHMSRNPSDQVRSGCGSFAHHVWEGALMAGRPRKLKAVPDEPVGNDRKLTPAIEETLASLELRPEDAGIARLALQYARTIDRAEAIAAQAAKLPFDPDTAEAVEQLRKRVSAQV